MSPKTSHLTALLATALAAAAVLPAKAQVPSDQGFFAAVDGRWMWLGGDRIESSLGAGRNATNGPGGQVLVGYRFDSQWDVALAGGVQQMLSELTQFRNGRLSVDTNHQHVDLELGYSTGNWRYSAGLRGLHYLQTVAYNAAPTIGLDSRDIYGIGVKAGIGGRYPLSDAFALVGGVDGALVMANFNDFGTGQVTPNGNYWGLIPQVGGELGVSWRTSEAPGFALTVGGRVDASFNTSIAAANTAGSRGTLFEYGPFVRVSYNFGGSYTRQQPFVPSTQVTSNAPQNYMVFFDFDRADITAVAQGTIRARRQRRQDGSRHAHAGDGPRRPRRLRRLQSGPVAAPGERGKGDAGPQWRCRAADRRGWRAARATRWWPTADGVREPQNRRVVISF